MNSSSKVNLLEYLSKSNDKLEPFNDGIDYIPICQFIYKTIKFKEYSNIQKSINYLRRLLKFEKQIFQTLFETISHLMYDIIKNEDNNSKEEILIFLCEIIFQRNLFGDSFYEWISEFIFILVKISLNDLNEKNKILGNFILIKLTEDIKMINLFIRNFNLSENEYFCSKIYDLFIKTLLNNIELIKLKNKIDWNTIYRFLGNGYKQGKKDLILKCVNEIKKICRDNGIDYKNILEEFTEYGMINSTLYFKELYEQFLFNNFLIKRLFSIYKKNYYFFLSVVIFV